MKKEHEELIRRLPKKLQWSFYYGYILDMASDYGDWHESVGWFYPVRHLEDLRKKAEEYEELLMECEK